MTLAQPPVARRATHGQRRHPAAEYALWALWVTARYTFLGYPIRGLLRAVRRAWAATLRAVDWAYHVVEQSRVDWLR